MLKPFNPAQSEGKQGVTKPQESEENPEENHEEDEAMQPKTSAAPAQPSPEEVENTHGH